VSLVVLATAQARAGAGVTQAMIDEEEAWLADRIGPLTGERTETFFLPARLRGIVDALYLSRKTDAVDTFSSDGDNLVVDTDWRLFANYIVERVGTSTASWDDPLVITYTPNDESIVKGVLYDLLAYRQLPANLQSIRIGQYSETYGTGGTDPVRRSLLARVQPGGGLGLYKDPFRIRRYAVDRTIVAVAES
jgi:hypothetical protein